MTLLSRIAQVYAERMASLAVSRKSQEALFKRFLALGAFQSSSDAREGLLVLPLLYDAEHRLGRDPRADVHRCRPF